MMGKIKSLSLFMTGIFFLCSLESVRAQSETSDEQAVRVMTTRTARTSQPAVPTTTTNPAARRPTPARPAAVSRTASPRRTMPGGFGGPGGRGGIGMPWPYRDKLADGLVKVECDDSILKIDEQVLEAIVNSSFVLSPEVQEQLIIEVRSVGGMEEQNLFKLTIFETREPEDIEHGAKKGDLRALDIPGEEEEGEGEGDGFLELPPADMISEIADQLKDILMAEFDKQRNQYRGKLEDAEVYLKPLEDKMRRLNDLERELFAKAGMSSLRRSDVLKQIQSLERKRQDMEMRLVEAAAREEALQKQIAILGKQTEEKLKQDIVLKELEHILKLREEEMKTVQKMVEAGQASQNEYFKVRGAVAQARIELVKRQETIHESIGGGATMQERVKELTDIAIMNAESQAVFQYIEEQLAIIEAKKILEIADQYEMEIALKQDSMLRSYEYAQKNVQRYRLNMQDSLPPSVSVLGEH